MNRELPRETGLNIERIALQVGMIFGSSLNLQQSSTLEGISPGKHLSP